MSTDYFSWLSNERSVMLAGRTRSVIHLDDSGCWLWTGCTNSKGYGVVSVNGRRELVHRVSYEENVGPIPEGLTIDHVEKRGCVSKLCCNPAHLEPVTRRENSQRYARSLSRGTRGHELTMRPGDRQRRCRACENERRHIRKALALAT